LVSFHNDPAGCAVRDAAVAGLVFARLKLEHTRTRRRSEVAPVA
jgi:hypothetical protein